MVGHTELHAQAERRYIDFLRSIVVGTDIFPLDLRLGKTNRAADYASYQNQLSTLRTAAAQLGIEIVWERVNAPRFGQHERPQSACFPNEETYLAALDKAVEVAGFRADLATIRASCPQMESWTSTSVRKILAYHGRWPQLMRTVNWFVKNPQCDLYLRQLPIPGVDTKFFEKHEAIIDDLLANAVPEHGKTTGQTFAEKHGLRRQEPLVRVRFLDPFLQSKMGFPMDDFSIPEPTFRALDLLGATAIITENLRNFLSLPKVENAACVLGSGHAATLLADSIWLKNTRIFYWGDIDGHGFLTLNRLRNFLPHVTSLMMDEETFDLSREFTGPATPVENLELNNLTVAENLMFQKVRDGSIALEQERIPYPHVTKILESIDTAVHVDDQNQRG
jgi:hypothetical protein